MDKLPPELLLAIFAYAVPTFSLDRPQHPRVEDERTARRLAAVSSRWRELLRPLREINAVASGNHRMDRQVRGATVQAAKLAAFSLRRTGAWWSGEDDCEFTVQQAVALQSLSVAGLFVESAQLERVSVDDTRFSCLDLWVRPDFLPSLRVLDLHGGCSRLLLHDTPVQRFPLLRGLACEYAALSARQLFSPSAFPPFLLLDVDPSTIFIRTRRDTSHPLASAVFRPEFPRAMPPPQIASIATHIRLVSPSTIALTLVEDPDTGRDFFRGLFRSKRTGKGRIEALYLEEVRDEEEDEVDKRAGRLIREVAREMGVPVEVARRGDQADEFVLPRSFVEDAMRE